MKKFYEWLAWRLPRKLVYYCAVRLMAYATTGRWGHEFPDQVRMMKALERWDQPHND